MYSERREQPGQASLGMPPPLRVTVLGQVLLKRLNEKLHSLQPCTC
jgi:hypothetical protein